MTASGGCRVIYFTEYTTHPLFCQEKFLPQIVPQSDSADMTGLSNVDAALLCKTLCFTVVRVDDENAFINMQKTVDKRE